MTGICKTQKPKQQQPRTKYFRIINRPASPTFPSRLRTRLRELAMSQAQFAKLAGITPTAAWRYVHGKTLPTNWDVRIRIALALGVSGDWINE